jgi:hypothetical protein
MVLNDTFLIFIADHTAALVNAKTPNTPHRYNSSEISVLAIIMIIKHNRIATIATRNPTPRAIHNMSSPATRFTTMHNNN